MKMKRTGFTLVEIMMVVAIIALLAAIAVPSFMQARVGARQSACINNLRLIDHAKEMWATACNKNTGDASDVTAVNGYLRAPPTCPSGGAYTYQTIGNMPTCSWTNHVLTLN